MTFLFKLSRRVASAPWVWAVSLAVLACSEAAPREFLSPDPGVPTPSNVPVALTVTSASGVLPYDQTYPFQAWGRLASGDSVHVAVSWVASAGQIGADGRYRGTVPGNHTVTAYAIASPSLSGSTSISVSNPGPLFASLSVAPKPVYIGGGARVLFGATARLQSGANTLPTVTWKATGGTVASNGDFAAGLIPGNFAVIATTLDGLLSDTALVVVEEASLTLLQLSPKVVTIPGGTSQDFEVAAGWTDGTNTIPELIWETSAGTVTPLSGGAGAQPTSPNSQTTRFTASTEPGTFKVVVRHGHSGKADTASVTITPVLQAVVVTPETVGLLPGVTAAFSAKGWMSDGAQSNVSVSWTATGGTITGSGIYTAGGTPGAFRVIGRLASGSMADTAAVQIAQTSASLTRLTISPGTGTAPVGGLVEFAAAALWSDGATALPELTWTAQAGTVTGQGSWTAPAIPGTYRVVARHATGTLADTAVFNVVVPPPSLASLSVSPEAPGVQGGALVEFQVAALWTDGGTVVPPLTWSATGGTVTNTGRWTAPNISGVYRVVAREAAGTRADTAVVTVAGIPHVVAIRVTPRLGSLNPGGTQQLSAQVTWNDGLTRPVAQAWSATGGTVSLDGLFTAGLLAGQAMIVASCAGCTVSDTSSFTITAPVVPAPTVTQLVLNPGTASLDPGDVLQFHVGAAWSDGSTAVPPLVWTAAGGTMDELNYFAGGTPGTHAVIVRVAGGTLADTAWVTISASGTGPSTLTALSLNPTSMTMAPGEQRTLTVGATWSDGSTTVPPLAWSIAGGTMNGLDYTAGTTSGTFRIIASEQGGTMADTTVVTIQAGPPATLQSLSVTPASASVPSGATLQFAVTGTWSDGSTTMPQVTWTATGGTIGGGGVYAAGGTAGTFQVTATHVASGLTAQQSVTITAPQAWTAIEPELPRVTVNVTYPTLGGQKINVSAGGNLQSAINGAACGDEILLAAGATFVGNFTLPAKACSGWIVIRTNTALPAERVRTTPQAAGGFAKILTSNNAPALTAALNARQYRVVGVEISAQPSVSANGALVTLPGNTATQLSQIPQDIIFDRVYVHGHATLALQRCIQLDGVGAAVIDSYISECHIKGFDSQAILMYASPGPAAILNNYLEGAGENIMLGGASPRIANVIPSDIVIRGNHFSKPTAWKGVWTIKNLFEIKNGQRVLVEGNLFENNWADAQVGQAILVKSANTGGKAPWSEASDVLIRYNLVRNSASGINVAADPGADPAVPASRIKFEHNVFESIGAFNGTSNPYFGLILGSKSGLRDVQFVHNTAVTNMSTSLFSFGGAIGDRLVIQDNFVSLGQYGIKGTGTGSGVSALTAYFRSYAVRGNALVGAGSLASSYPTGNTFVSPGQSVSGLRGVDGTVPGANQAEVQRQTGLALSGNR